MAFKGHKTATAQALQYPKYDNHGIYRIPAPYPVEYSCRFNVNEYGGDVDQPDLIYEDDVEEFEDCLGPSADVVDEEEILTEIESLKLIRKPGCWQISIRCPVDLFGCLIGKQGKIKREFDNEFPGVETEFVKGDGVVGRVQLTHRESRRMLLAAGKAMNDRILNEYPKLSYTHFLSLPFLRADNPVLNQSGHYFMKSVMGGDNTESERIDESIFIPTGQYHFTVCMLKLYYPEQIEAVCRVLESLISNPLLKHFFQPVEIDLPDDMELPPRGFHVKLKGVHIMNDDPKDANVLYTAEEYPLSSQKDTWLHYRRSASSYMNTLVEIIVELLSKEGIVDWNGIVNQKLVDPSGQIRMNLHCTVINTKRRAARTFKRPKAERPSFNATRILRDFKNFDFGVAVITGIHLSKLAKPSADTLYYPAEKQISICQTHGF